MRFDEINTLRVVNLPCYHRELQPASEKQHCEISISRVVNDSTTYSYLPCYHRELQPESEKQKPLATILPLLPKLPQLQLHISIMQLTIIHSNVPDQNNTVRKIFDKIRSAAPVGLCLLKLPSLFHWLASLFHS